MSIQQLDLCQTGRFHCLVSVALPGLKLSHGIYAPGDCQCMVRSTSAKPKGVIKAPTLAPSGVVEQRMVLLEDGPFRRPRRIILQYRALKSSMNPATAFDRTDRLKALEERLLSEIDSDQSLTPAERHRLIRDCRAAFTPVQTPVRRRRRDSVEPHVSGPGSIAGFGIRRCSLVSRKIVLDPSAA